MAPTNEAIVKAFTTAVTTGNPDELASLLEAKAESDPRFAVTANDIAKAAGQLHSIVFDASLGIHVCLEAFDRASATIQASMN